jgi:large subunit ribosomal protein L18
MTAKSRVARKRRHRRVRMKISGTPDRPRLNIYRSSKHIYAQVIDDVDGKTIAAASTIDKTVMSQIGGKNKKEQAAVVGEVIAERAKAAGVSQVVFDRGGFRYHGRVQALAKSARDGGLKF